MALDTIQARSMGIDPGSVGHLETCAARGVGTNDLTRIDVRGLDSVQDCVSFQPAEARIGTERLWFAGGMIGNCSPCSGHRTGILAGVRLDADGSRVPRAWTIPVDAYWYVPWDHEHLHIGAVGGVRVRFAGAERAFGWTAGLDFVFAHQLQYGDRPKQPTDWHVELGVERVADLMLVALTVGTASAGRYNADGRDW